MALPISLACHVSYHLGCMFFFLLCVLRELAPLIFLAMDTQKHRQGKEDGKRCGAVCVMFLSVTSSPWHLTPSSRLCHLLAGWPQSQQVMLIERPCDGHKIIWVPAVPILGVLACKPRNKQRMPFKWDLCVPGTCVYNMNRRRTGDMLL